MRTIAIDPGLRNCGVAIGENGQLIACALVSNPDKKSRNAAAWSAMALAVKAWADNHGPFAVAVSETPMQYLPGHLKGKRVDPDDLLQLQGVVGALSMAFPGLKTIQPYQWKRQLPKDVCFTRIKSRLSPEESAHLSDCKCAPSLLHNVGDAIGIYLDSVGRFRQ